jgi:hypothetical protein
MKKFFSIIFYALVFWLISFEKVLAVCPVCTVAVGAGLGFSRWVGIDDSIAGLWIGGLVVSMAYWTLNWLESKNIKFKAQFLLVMFFYILLVMTPLKFLGLLGDSLEMVGVDKLMFGIIIGGFGFWFGANWYFYLKEKNNGHAHFPFQKVVMTVAPLLILSFIFYFITK